jgi:hypothetical protein
MMSLANSLWRTYNPPVPIPPQPAATNTARNQVLVATSIATQNRPHIEQVTKVHQATTVPVHGTHSTVVKTVERAK